MSTTLPKTMHAFVLTGHGGFDKLVWKEDWPVPELGPQDVLIKVSACGLNNTDINTRTGWYSKTVTEATTGGEYDVVGEADPAWGGSPVVFPRIQGADVTGTIVAVGDDAPVDYIGKRVIADTWIRNWGDPLNKDSTYYFGSECDGGFAQYSRIDYRNIGLIDSPFSDAELATFSCSYTTAEGMLYKANVNETDTVLITGASGGVGSALVQLAKRRGAKVIAMASEQKHEALKQLGADVLLPRNPVDLTTSLKQETGSETVSVVADVVGGVVFPSLVNALHRGGRYTCSGAIAGPIVDLDLRTLYLNDLSFLGSTVVEPHIFRSLVKYINEGEIQPMLAHTYPLKDLHAAQQLFIDKQHVGNIVVTVD